MIAVLFRRKIRYGRMWRASGREKGLIVIRSLANFVLGAGLYALATQQASIGAVSAMQVVPMLALFGIIILHEQVTRRKLGIIVIGFIGALLVVVQSTSDIHFGVGELLSLIAGALFSLSFVLRRLQTGELNDYELALFVTIIGAACNYLLSGVVDGSWVVGAELFAWPLFLTFVVAALFGAAASILANYGIEHVKETTANVILNMELVFGIIVGYVVFEEILTPVQFVGACIILVVAAVAGYGETHTRRVHVVKHRHLRLRPRPKPQ